MLKRHNTKTSPFENVVGLDVEEEEELLEDDDHQENNLNEGKNF